VTRWTYPEQDIAVYMVPYLHWQRQKKWIVHAWHAGMRRLGVATKVARKGTVEELLIYKSFNSIDFPSYPELK
jgi:DNA-binding phage protein